MIAVLSCDDSSVDLAEYSAFRQLFVESGQRGQGVSIEFSDGVQATEISTNSP